MKSLINMFNEVKLILNKEDYKSLLMLLILTIFVSLVEIIGIAAVIPFLSLALNPDLVFENEYYLILYNLFSFNSPISFIISIGAFLVFFYLLRGALNVFYNYRVAKFHYIKYQQLSTDLFKKYLNISYLDYTKLNSSYLIKSIVVEAQEFTALLEAMILVFSELLIFIAVLILFFVVDAKTTAILLSFLSIMAFLIGKNIFPIIKKQGSIRSKNQELFFESVNRSLNNFKLFKFDKNKNHTIEAFYNYSRNFSKSNIISSTLNGIPRHLMEGLAFSVVVGLTVLILLSGKDIQGSLNIELLLLYVLGLYRLMPSINRILSGYNSMLFHSSSLPIIHNSLKYTEEDLKVTSLSFKSNIKLENVNFNYQDTTTLQNINITINKGSKVAFIGDSGSGKTTLVDIIIGLIKPASGKVMVDGESLANSNTLAWRYKVGYVPQDIYLFDGTIGENVAFSKNYNSKQVEEALQKAKVFDVVKERGGIDANVGDRGVFFSGGQKQRIGIARALYNSPEVLVFDEATSALDEKTEKEIMNEIYQITENITILIISHKLKMVQGCNKIFKVKDHGVSEIT